MPGTRVPQLTSLLSPEEVALIASLAVRRKYRDNDIVHEKGDDGYPVGLLLSGKIKLIYPCADGHEVFSGLIHAGQNYGDAPLLQGLPRMHRLVAIGDTVIDHLSAEAFYRLLESAGIVRGLYEIASHRLAVTLDLLDDMRRLSPELRLAKLVLRMHLASGGDRLEYLQEEFAGMLGVSSVTLAKALRQLVQDGVVETGYRHIRIGDTARLEAWVREQVTD